MPQQVRVYRELNLRDGAKITGDALGFFGVTPVAKASAYTQTYTTADKTHIADGSSDVVAANATAIAEGSADGVAAGGFATAAARQAAMNKVDVIVTLANELKADYNLLRAQVLDLKQLVNSVIDDLQAYGLVG